MSVSELVSLAELVTVLNLVSLDVGVRSLLCDTLIDLRLLCVGECLDVVFNFEFVAESADVMLLEFVFSSVSVDNVKWTLVVKRPE